MGAGEIGQETRALQVAGLPPKIRAFVAIRVNQRVEEAITGFIDELRSRGDAVSWTHRDKLHVTLKFLGVAVDSEKIAPLAQSLLSVARNTPILEVRTRGVGGFPDLRRPRVLWVALECPQLGRLVARIENAAVRAGFEASDRPWSPHLTVGRVRDPRRAKHAFKLMNEARERDFGVSQIGQIALYRSHLLPEGSVHEPLATFPLVAR